jgi:pre-mRNA-processing factor 17
VKYNPKYDELFAPEFGPSNPFKTQQQAAKKNHLAGYVEHAHVNEFQFETQRRTFQSFKYAYDPSATSETEGDKLIGSEAAAAEADFKTVFEDNKERPLDKRKRAKNTDPSDIEGYLGPWAKYADEETVSKPTDEDAAYLEEYLAKRQKKGKREEEVPMEEKSTLHIKDDKDYQGRTFLHPPQDLGINLKSDEPPAKCFIPKRQIHTWTGHNKGISVIRWFPGSAHLILSGSMDHKVN